MNSILIFLISLTSVWSIGLREEFTWTRISYIKTDSRYYIRREGKHKQPEGIFFPEDTLPKTNDDVDNELSEDYIYQNNIPMSANRWRNKLFVTVPRRRPGIPSTLNYVPMNSTQRHNVPLIPYPDQPSNRLRDDGSIGIVSIYRVAIDACNRLWAVDTGKIETPGNASQVQPTSLLIYDLETDTLIRRYVFKDTDVLSTSTLPDVTVDVTATDCGDAYAYIPDLSAFGLVVYSFRENNSWRLRHNYFYLEPLAGELSVGGHNFQWTDGIFSITLSAVQRDGYRTAYFHAMAGVNIYTVSTRILKDRQLATRSYHGNDFKVFGQRKLGYQSSTSFLYQPNGVLFLGLVNQNALGCVNTRSRHLSDPLEVGIIQKDDEKMIYPCDVKIYKDEVILLTNSMPVFLYGQLDYTKTNFRIWMENVDKAVEGTNCAQ